jgi:hypothetical protein
MNDKNTETKTTPQENYGDYVARGIQLNESIGIKVKEVSKLVLNSEKPVRCVNVLGTAQKVERKDLEGPEGPFTITTFHGLFQAENLLDGKKYWSNKLTMPKIGSDLLASLLEDHETAAVKFGYTFIAEPTPEQSKVQFPYIWGMNIFVKPDGNPFAEMQALAPKPEKLLKK